MAVPSLSMVAFFFLYRWIFASADQAAQVRRSERENPLWEVSWVLYAAHGLLRQHVVYKYAARGLLRQQDDYPSGSKPMGRAGRLARTYPENFLAGQVKDQRAEVKTIQSNLLPAMSCQPLHFISSFLIQNGDSFLQKNPRHHEDFNEKHEICALDDAGRWTLR